MTEHERDIYMLLCMSGRSWEATKYRAACEQKQIKRELRAEELEQCEKRENSDKE